MAVVVPKKGFDDFIRMACEIGVDFIQPLISHRSAPKLDIKMTRLLDISREAVEQSERMWMPKIYPPQQFHSWLDNLPSNASFSIACTRKDKLLTSDLWFKTLPKSINYVWMVIGPEGGWTNEEEILANEFGLVPVSLGQNILRTSTASIVASSQLISIRDKFKG